MSLSEDTIVLTLHISEQDNVDTEELDRLTSQLHAELEDLDDIESITYVSDQVSPSGAKAVDPLTLGALLIVVLPTVLPKVMEFIQAWTLRGEGRTVKVKVQRGNQVVEVEYPKTMTPDEAKEHIDMVMRELPHNKK